MAHGERATDGGCDCKVGRMIAAYGLDGLDDRLVERWLGQGEASDSIRDLTEYLNRELLRAAMEREGLTLLDGEVANLYRLLTDDDVSVGMGTQVRMRLEREDVDVEQVEADFVSHQSVYRHITGCLDVSKDEPSDEERVENSTRKIRSLQNRTSAVTEDTLAQLRNADRLALEDFEVFTEVSVLCTECGRQHEVGELLSVRGCECQK